MEVGKFKSQMRRQEIEINLEHSMLEGIISKKEYVSDSRSSPIKDAFIKKIEEQKDMIA